MVVVLFCLGLWLASSGASWRVAWVKPGGLSHAHAVILQDTSLNNRCIHCHDVPSADGVVAEELAGLSQSQRCLRCHDRQIVADRALNPHSMTNDRLANATAVTAQSVLSRLGHLSQLECSQCHSEHHGEESDLTQLTQDNCNVCHAQKFTRFAEHPEFDPVQKLGPGVLKFDHATHASRHFADKKTHFDCQLCHLATVPNQVVATVDFATGCASCHREPLETSLAGGLPILAIPMLDIAALRKAKLPVGNWPANAVGDFDGRLPPLMVALLAADPQLAPVWDRFNYSLDLIDVDPTDSEDLRLVQQLAWGIKRLLGELAEAGPAALRQRLEASLQRPASSPTWQRILTTLSDSTFRDLRDQWFDQWESDLEQDPTQQNPTQKEPTLTVSVNQRPAELRKEAAEAIQELGNQPSGRWVRDDETYTLSYLARGHADMFLQGWYQLFQEAGEQHSPSLGPLQKAWLDPAKAGQCMACHQVDLSEPRSMRWSARENESSASWPLTHFSHGPHLTQRSLRGCITCHETVSGTAAGFAPIRREICASCHHAQAAGDQCAKCHYYHDRSVSP